MRRLGVELHNVESLTETDDGYRLDRLPPSVRSEINENAREMYTWAAGCEVRFVGDGSVTVTLSCPDGECLAVPHYGSFAVPPEDHVTLGPEPTTVELSVPDQLLDLDPDERAALPFDPAVARLQLQGQPVRLHGVDGDVRPPTDDELPDTRLLSYGTSITQGLVASAGHLTYAARTARRLDADLLNLGTSGSAHCERAIADHIAGRSDWDIATVAVSVNMLSNGFSAAEFEERARYFIDTVASAHPEKPVVAITLFPIFPDFRPKDEPDEWGGTVEEYRETLRSVVGEIQADNVHLVEGPDLLEDISGLSVDLVHPTDYGMLEIGDRLAARLEEM